METTENLSEAIAAIRELAATAAKPQIVELQCDDGKDVVEIPMAVAVADGSMLHLQLLPAIREGNAWARENRLRNADGPDSREGTAVHQSLTSFIAHVNRFKAVNSAVWANQDKRELVSVLDYHHEGTGAPRWGRHRGVYACPLSEAWAAWGGGKPLKLDQEAFAALLDGRDRELAGGTLPNGKPAPDPAALISLAANLEVYSTATAKRERDPNTGRVRIAYAEDKGVSGSVQPPTAFLIHVPIFVTAAPEMLEVRLRVDVRDGAAEFTVQIHAAGDVLRAAFAGLCERVKAETSLPVFVGTPEA